MMSVGENFIFRQKYSNFFFQFCSFIFSVLLDFLDTLMMTHFVLHLRHRHCIAPFSHGHQICKTTYTFCERIHLQLGVVGRIGVARRGAQGARPLSRPIKIPPIIENYDNIA